MNSSKITRLVLYNQADINEIPDIPEHSDIWMLNHETALWYSTFDNKWRLMLFKPFEKTNHSVEFFETKEEAYNHFTEELDVTWTTNPIGWRHDGRIRSL